MLESSARFIKTQTARLHPSEFLIQQIWGGAGRSIFLVGSQVILKFLILGSHLDSQKPNWILESCGWEKGTPWNLASGSLGTYLLYRIKVPPGDCDILTGLGTAWLHAHLWGVDAPTCLSFIQDVTYKNVSSSLQPTEILWIYIQFLPSCW